MPTTLTSKFLVTGSTGLIGSRFVSLYQKRFSIITFGRKDNDAIIDLTSEKEVRKFVEETSSEVVINFAAYTKVDEAEKDKADVKGEVYTLNTLLPLWLSKACLSSGKKLVHISTDYVFDGKKENQPYNEDDAPHPLDSWYSTTKFMGEENIKKVFGKRNDYIIARVSYPYSGLYDKKMDFARIIVYLFEKSQPYLGTNDQKIKPVCVDDIVQTIDFLIKKGASGIYHIAGDYSPKEFTNPYQFALKVVDFFGFDSSLIKPISFADYAKGKAAPRPRHTWLDTTKLESLGFKLTNVDQSLKTFKNQLTNKK